MIDLLGIYLGRRLASCGCWLVGAAVLCFGVFAFELVIWLTSWHR